MEYPLRICEMMIGLPASGKSTMIEKMKDEFTFVYSTDDEITRLSSEVGLTYDQGFEQFVDEATQNMNAELDFILNKTDKDVIWDQTNLGFKKRANIINHVKKFNFQVRGHCFLPPQSEDDKIEYDLRLASREGKTIPPHIITSMQKNYVLPNIQEGFDSISFYNIHGDLIGIDYD